MANLSPIGSVRGNVAYDGERGRRLAGVDV